MAVEYEWYAAINDGTYTVTGPVWKFMTEADPTAVDLANFSAAPNTQAIQLFWETSQEVHLIGFNVYRSETAGGTRVQLNPSLIPAKGPGRMFGASYQYDDSSAAPGKVYTYWLELVRTDDNQLAGPVAAVLPYGYKIWLPNILR